MRCRSGDDRPFMGAVEGLSRFCYLSPASPSAAPRLKVPMMPVLETFEALKGNALGIIFLGAIGSLVATVTAFSSRYVANRFARRVKATQWDFGWMSAYCDRELMNIPIFVNFLVAHVSRIILLCTITISMVVISVFFLFVSKDLLSYGFAIAPLSIGVYTFIASYSDYKSLKLGLQWWIDERKKEQTKPTFPAAPRTRR
jgi:hypothetical protein